LHNINEAIILAGGLGTRLRSVVNDKQKVMAEVSNRPFISYLIDNLSNANIKKVILALGHLSETVIENIQEFCPNSVELLISKEDQPLGTGGAIKKASEFVTKENVLIMNGDSIIFHNLEKLIEFHSSKNAIFSMLLSKSNNSSRFGLVTVNKNHEIIQFHEKTKDLKPRATQGLINAGVYVANTKLLRDFKSERFDIEKDVFPSLIGNSFYGLLSNRKLLDIGIPEDYSIAEEFIKNEIRTFDNI